MAAKLYQKIYGCIFLLAKRVDIEKVENYSNKTDTQTLCTQKKCHATGSGKE